jgi:hypothetical protein
MKGPVPGFSKGVNDSLVAAASLAHFKTTGLLGFSLTLAGILISRRPPSGAALILHYSSVILLILSSAFAGVVIYPVKETRRGGHIFWGDIILYDSAASYAQAVEKLGAPEDAEREYAFTNYRLSRILDVKYGFIRWAICLLLLGSVLASVGLALEF